MATSNHSYEHDFYAWAMHNANLIHEGRLAEIDVEHIAEEIESMGRSAKRELLNRLAILIFHLLKWRHQPERRSKSWTLTIKHQRLEISELLAESPSLKNELDSKFSHAYEKALVYLADETGIAESALPPKCPFSLENCLDSNFLPEQ